MIRLPLRALALAAFLSSSAMAQGRPDVLVADFEGETYHPWFASGEAFGTAPVRGTLPGQMSVEGFEGKGLVNSFRGGDDSTGSLTSPPFLIERTHLNFLIGGGKFPGETCLDLLVDGQVVRSSTGPNDRPGGSERLDWASWNVADLAGKSVILRVVDRRKGGWGHVNVDQIVQSDRPRGLVATAIEMVVEQPYLLVPVDGKSPIRRVQVAVDGRVVREFDVKLAEGKPDFDGFLDLAPFQGRRLKVEAVLPVESKVLGSIRQANAIVDDAYSLYHETGRPRFHFTSRRGWLNDPNGLVFFEGEYHLFYQHNPYGWDWGNMHWGHAVGPDLIHWKELPVALYPREYGDWAFSGSAVVDRANTSGFGTPTAPPLVAAFTSTGRGECLVSSLDKGRTWVEYAGNPVVRHQGRDPRLLWHAPTHRWVMAVYDEEGGRRDVAFYSSPDLKSWTFESRIGGFFECPDLFELPVEGVEGKSLWVLSAADGAYLLGEFDGKAFRPEPGEKRKTWYGNFYAAQTFSNEPKGRRVQVGWAQGIDFPGQKFNQQMAIPCELTLRRTEDGIRLFAYPVAEVDRLHSLDVPFGSPPQPLPMLGVEGAWSLLLPSDLLDIQIEVEIVAGGRFELKVPGATVTYDLVKRTLACNGTSAALDPVGGTIKLRMLVDRGSIEVFANEGRLAISRGLTRPREEGRMTGRGFSEGTRVRSVNVHPMNSAWD